MNKSFSFVLLWVFLFFWTNSSKSQTDRMRSFSIAGLSPFANISHGVRDYLDDRPLLKSRESNSSEIAMLRLENSALQTQLQLAKELVLHEKGLERGQGRKGYIIDLFQRQSKAILGSVIYRVPISWNQCLWIDVGQKDNELYGEKIIGRNSPVTDGRSLIGVIDYVGEKESRIRLITDSGLNPAVRVERGSAVVDEIVLAMKALSDRLENYPECAKKIDEAISFLPKGENTLYLAKGELRGSTSPFWKTKPILKGAGFNYDYPDKNGPSKLGKNPLIQKNDLLITSGLDGVFPFGIPVATVVNVAPIPTGGFAYEIEAVPTASSIYDLKQVFVLPPLSDE